MDAFTDPPQPPSDIPDVTVPGTGPYARTTLLSIERALTLDRYLEIARTGLASWRCAVVYQFDRLIRLIRERVRGFRTFQRTQNSTATLAVNAATDLIPVT